MFIFCVVGTGGGRGRNGNNVILNKLGLQCCPSINLGQGACKVCLLLFLKKTFRNFLWPTKNCITTTQFGRIFSGSIRMFWKHCSKYYTTVVLTVACPDKGVGFFFICWTVFLLFFCFFSFLGVTVLEGPIYAVGGHDGWSYLNTVERWDPQNQQWTFVASMSIARSTVGVAALNGKWVGW